MTVPMVSTNSSPPIAMPVQVPPGHVVQQIVDESGTLRHVILSPQPPIVPMPPHAHNQHYVSIKILTFFLLFNDWSRQTCLATGPISRVRKKK